MSEKSPFKKGDLRPGRPRVKKKAVDCMPLPGPKDVNRMRRKGRQRSSEMRFGNYTQVDRNDLPPTGRYE